MLKQLSRIAQALFYIYAGVNHFRQPKFYLRIMPPYIPNPELVNWLSGLAEIVLGIGLLIPRLTRRAAWGIIALLIAVFPANVYHFTSGGAGMKISRNKLLARLPFQLVFGLWAYWHTRENHV